MTFTAEERLKVLHSLNQALLRSHQQHMSYEGYSGDFYRMDAVLSPTEYQASTPQPLLFEEADINQRLDAIVLRSATETAQVRAIIVDLDNTEVLIKGLLTDPNYSIRKLDKVEIDLSRRTEGAIAYRNEMIERLRYRLGLPPTPQPQVTATSYRS